VEIVKAVTDGPGKNRKERKADMYPRCAALPKAIIVKLCDRIANVEEAIKCKNTGHFQMYLKEYPDFERHLLKRDGPAALWKYLFDLLTWGKSVIG
jgi:hypothetical protein